MTLPCMQGAGGAGVRLLTHPLEPPTTLLAAAEVKEEPAAAQLAPALQRTPLIAQLALTSRHSQPASPMIEAGAAGLLQDSAGLGVSDLATLAGETILWTSSSCPIVVTLNEVCVCVGGTHELSDR
jgi:hypothetical protein